MTQLFLSQTIKTEEYTEILNIVDSKEGYNKKLYTQAVASQYKFVSEVVNAVNVTKKQDVRKKSIKAMMQESVFHGAGWMGSNFIA